MNFHSVFRRAGLMLLAAATLIPALSAQVDLSGPWTARLHEDWAERGPGPEAVDYLGLPINEEARARALAYSISQLSLPERQCQVYGPYYLALGPFGLKMWTESHPVTDKVIAWKLAGAPDLAVMTIWMDGRPHPSANALHTFSGFTTGVWEGDVLTTTTTHMKAGFLRRNGVPLSDQTVMTRHFARHGEFLTVTEVLEDPIYLTEPHIISRTWQLDPKAEMVSGPYNCEAAAEVATLDGAGDVPHIFPGENTFTGEMTKMYNIPEEAVLGGAETLYPEYRKRLKDNYVAPEKCIRYCCGWEGGAPTDSIQCIGVGYSTPGAPFGRKF
jgi:hypothetical protein